MASTAPNEGKPETLVVPHAPEPLDEENYPLVPYWQEADWMTHCEHQKDHGKTTPKLGFLTDDDGNPLMESTIKKFMFHAKLAWNELYCHWLNSRSWIKKTPKSCIILHAYHEDKLP